MSQVKLRKAEREDAATVLRFIERLAEYERLSHECVATEEELAGTLFGERRFAEVLLAEVDGKTVGFALYFYQYSTFKAAPTLWLEDLFVDPDHRGKGVGKALLKQLCRIAQDEGCARVEIGGCSTGTSRPSSSTSRSARDQCRTGRCTGWTRWRFSRS